MPYVILQNGNIGIRNLQSILSLRHVARTG